MDNETKEKVNEQIRIINRSFSFNESSFGMKEKFVGLSLLKGFAIIPVKEMNRLYDVDAGIVRNGYEPD